MKHKMISYPIHCNPFPFSVHDDLPPSRECSIVEFEPEQGQKLLLFEKRKETSLEVVVGRNRKYRFIYKES